MAKTYSAKKSGSPKAYFAAKPSTKFKASYKPGMSGAPKLSHADLTVKSKALGELLGRELNSHQNIENTLKNMNANLDSKFGSLKSGQVANIERTIEFVANGDKGAAKKAWRSVEPGTDEVVSTATIVDLMSGMGKNELRSPVIREALKLVSRARFPTRQVGYNMNGSSEIFQHPTDEDKALYAKSNTNHYEKDINRRSAVLDAGLKASKGGVERLVAMIARGLSFTSNDMVAPPFASNVKLRSSITKVQGDESHDIRESRKRMYYQISGDTPSGMQSQTAPYFRDPSRRSPSPMRCFGSA
jgi:hypothetical protein